MPIKPWLACFICCLVSFSAVSAEQIRLTVINAYMPAMPPVSRTAAVYLKLTNETKSIFILEEVSTSVAKHAMIHQTIETDGVVKMKHQSSLVINPGEALEFSPGGTHIMLMGLQSSGLSDKFVLNLIFDRHPSQQIEVKIRSRTIR